eukprot:8277469-Lingulodinium_polyedra.AAC.1
MITRPVCEPSRGIVPCDASLAARNITSSTPRPRSEIFQTCCTLALRSKRFTFRGVSTVASVNSCCKEDASKAASKRPLLAA